MPRKRGAEVKALCRRVPIRLAVSVALALGMSVGVASIAAAGYPDVKLTPPKTCGQHAAVKHTGSSGRVIAQLPKSAQASYKQWPFPVKASPWANYKGRKGPWKIGFIAFPIATPWQTNLLSQLKKEFAKAKAKRLVTGTLQTYIQTSWATATPEQQSAAIEQMVANGVDAIVLQPLSAVAEAKAIDAAGKAGVPIVLTSDTATNSKYSINTYADNTEAFAGILGILKVQGKIGGGKTLNVLRIHGAAGVNTDQIYHDFGTADMSACPGLKTVGALYGDWNPAKAKSEVLKFLASHPEKVDLVIQNGSMQSGIIQAFESAGRPVPPMSYNGTGGGDLSWWLDHNDTYQTVAYEFTGAQVAYTTFRILLRILAGRQLIVSDVSLPAWKVTNATLPKVATPGKPVTWVGDSRGPVNGWASDKVLDRYFKKKGTPGG